MIYDLLLADRAKTTNKEKEQCKLLIPIITTFSEKARIKGLLSLEYDRDIDQIEDPILKQGLQLIVDGTDPEIIKNKLSTHIYYGGYKGQRLLELIMILDGVLMLQAGDHPSLVTMQLTAYLGIEPTLDKIDTTEFEEYVKRLSKKNIADPTDFLEKIFSGINDIGIQKVLNVIDSAELSIAMMKTSEYMLFKLYNNMSLKRGFVVKEMIEYHQVIIKEDKILKNQKKLEVIIIKLKDCGEIMTL